MCMYFMLVFIISVVVVSGKSGSACVVYLIE